MILEIDFDWNSVKKKTNYVKSRQYKVGILFFIFTLFCSFGLKANDSTRHVTLSFADSSFTVSGFVKDSIGQPISGVSVSLIGKSIRSVTDSSGFFELKGVSLNDRVEFYHVSFKRREIPAIQIGREVQLFSIAKELDEVVVVGYGSVKKSAITGSVAKVNNDNLQYVPSSRPETALQGKLSGVNISQTRSQPGASPLIRIRGVGSIDAGNDPLIVVDGFPGGSFDNINMNDIASIEVLKDASSASIYGSRASGGVIIITTKSSKNGKPQISFNPQGGFSKAILHNDWLDVKDYYDAIVKYQNREYNWVGGDVSVPVWGDDSRPLSYRVSPAILNGNNVNWQNAVMKSAGFQNYSLSVSGGDDKVKYYFSGLYTDQQGTLLNTWNKVYGVRSKVVAKLNNNFEIGLSLTPNYISTRVAPNDMTYYAKYPPFVAIQNEDGSYPKARSYWNSSVTSQANPMAILQGTNYNLTKFSTIGNIYANVRVFKNLYFKTSESINAVYKTEDRFQSTWASSSGTSSGSANDYKALNLISENTLNYKRDFSNKHFIDILAGASFQKENSRTLLMNAVNNSFNNNIIQTLNNAVINPNGSYTIKSKWGMISYFGRVNYNYENKYVLSALIRTDGASRFGDANKWGYFPSVSVAWNMTEEQFMKNLEFVSMAKIRASFGKTGNMNIGDFSYLGTVTGGYYTINDQITNWLTQTTFGNDQLSWEKTKEVNLGMDIGFMQNKVNLSFDYYVKQTSNLLYNVSIPAITGFNSSISNIGKVQNKGVEISLSVKPISGKLNWDFQLNVARNFNKILDLGGVDERITTDSYGMGWILKVGEPMFSYYGYKMKGVITDNATLNSVPIMAGEKLGNPIYEDLNADGKINADDRQLLGNYMPKFILGMTHRFRMNDFDLSFSLQSSLGGKVYNFENQFYQGTVMGAMRSSLIKNEWWSVDDPGDGKTPALALSQLSYNANNDFYIENTSFVALRNINFGYSFGLNKFKMFKSLRVFASVNNVFVLTGKGFHGYNPEGYTGGEINGISSIPGYNAGSEPMNRVYTMGLNVNF